MKRIFLFLATNLAVLVVISITFRLLGLDRVVMTSAGMDMTTLLIFSAVIGFSGALISLFMSKTMAKHGMGVHVIEQPANAHEHWLVGLVQQLGQTHHGRHLGIRQGQRVAVHVGELV